MLGQPKKISGGNLKNDSIKEASKKNERKTAKKLGGNVTPGSGAFEGHKGDIKLDDFLLEQKETSNKSIQILIEHLLKITREANSTNKTGCMVYKFLETPPNMEKEWVLIPLSSFKELIEE